MRLEGKSVLVTGATGIAASGVARFASEGARVFFISVDADECAALADAVGDVGWACADLTDETATVEAMEKADRYLNGVDGLFAVAGGSGRKFGDGSIHQVSLDAWESTISLNLTTSFLAAREVIAAMLKAETGGSVVLVSSVLAASPSPELFATHAYAAAKGAQLALTTSMASSYAPNLIRVNAIMPGLVRTPMTDRASSHGPTVEYAATKQPLSRGFLEPSDVVDAAVFLLSDESHTVTGQILAVDGGWSVTEPRS